MRRFRPAGLLLAVSMLAACGEVVQPTSPEFRVDPSQLPAQAQERARLFAAATPEVLELEGTVFADNDEVTGQLVFGIERPGVAARVQAVMVRQGAAASSYRIVTVPPIQFMTSLRDPFLPTVGGIQIHFSNYLCTLGFNVDHGAGRSFITNSHCTDQQGTTGSTAYYQPASGINPTPIAFEAHDPSYTSLPGCSKGKACRRSDASRALYQASANSTRGKIAKTTGVNSGNLTTNGEFTITAQADNAISFSGVVHKVGRTTGWTSGSVTNTCATVNVSRSNIQLLCQTLVQNSGTVIVNGGDSGSPTFQITAGNDVTLVGILWGGSSDGHMFVFSPLSGIQDELGAVSTTFAETSGGNTAPTASFTRDCTSLECTFNGSGSTDPENNITSYDWSFGDGSSGSGAAPQTKRYAVDGQYTVTLTVTDVGGLSNSSSQTFEVAADPAPGDDPAVLSVSTRGNKKWNFADLTWSGSSASSIEIRRNGSLLATTSNSGSYTDRPAGGTWTYKVCNAGTQTCSNEVTVTF